MPPALAPTLSPSATAASPAERRASARAADAAPSPAGIAISRVWFAFAIGSLVLAGLLSLLLVIGRLPFLSGIFTDPLFFKRALVVHVDLALVVWFQAGAAAFLGLALGRALPRRLVGLSFALCSAGVFGLLAGAVMPGAEPILANYVPVVDHPVFITGLIAWFVGTGIFFTLTLTARSADVTSLPADVLVALKAAAAGNLIALATFAIAWRTTLSGLPPIGFYELVMWGGGHALQAANVALMLALWLLLLQRWSGRSVLSAGASAGLLAALILPHGMLPFVAALGTSNGAYVELSTDLMRWTLFPVILIVLGFSIRHIVLWWNAAPSCGRSALTPPELRAFHRDYRLVGFFGSATLAAMGLILGAMIRGSNTLVPGHYHAAIGAVTLALMTAAYDLCRALSPRDVAERIIRGARAQLLIFGVGQAVFALGFAIAGVHGLGRKQYGVEQHVRTAGEYLGLGVMGVGGVLAVVGGLLFLAIMLRCAAAWRRSSLSLNTTTQS